MSRDELVDRSRQELAKRADALLFRVGYDFAPAVSSASASSLGNFFFQPESVSAIVALLRHRIPQQVQEIVRRADKICRHEFDLLGYEGLEFGDHIDWHLDLIHGKRAPRKPFYKVRYLDFSEVGDSKITWELNRHQHLVTLAKAYRLTNDSRYADEIFGQWRHWHAENPYPIGINWASSLEVAFRSHSWLWVYFLLVGTPAMPPGFREEWLRAQAINGRHIERYLSTYFSPNTHLLGEAVALFFLGTLCPELQSAGRWKQRGWKIVLEQARRQVQADGFHFEQSTFYHVYALDFFLQAAVLASINGVGPPPEFEATLEKMFRALLLLGRTGLVPSLGDDDGGRLFDSRRNRSEQLLDPLATGAILFQRGDFKALADGLREETIWLLGEAGIAEWDRLEPQLLDWHSAGLKSAGLYLLSSPESRHQLVIDAGPQGSESAGHGHADALSVCLQGQGRSLLLDPGTFEYVGEGNERDVFRGTAMHNTLLVDGVNQSQPAGPFAWQRLTSATVEKWIQGETFDVFVGSHDAYSQPQSAVVHRRWVCSLTSGLWLVRDVAEGRGKHRLDITWHLGPDLYLEREHVFRVKGASQGLAVLPAEGHGWAELVRKESWSPAYGKKSPMTVLNFGTVANLPGEFVTLLLPLRESHGEPGRFLLVRSATEAAAVRAYRFEDGSGEHSFYFAEECKSWKCGVLASDAEFVCWSALRNGESIVRFCQGSYVKIYGQSESRCKRAVTRCEIVRSGKRLEVFCSDPDAIETPLALNGAEIRDGSSMLVNESVGGNTVSE
jgi:hypothetical protein